MYITPDLFAGADPLQKRSPSPMDWNTKSDARSTMSLGKRKRKAHGDDGLEMLGFSVSTDQPSPTSKFRHCASIHSQRPLNTNNKYTSESRSRLTRLRIARSNSYAAYTQRKLSRCLRRPHRLWTLSPSHHRLSRRHQRQISVRATYATKRRCAVAI